MENIKILVIDDSEFLRNAMKKFFANYDFDVTICSSGLEGIKFAARIIPDIIFLDLMMPNFNGLDVIKSIKALEPCSNIPIVLITAHRKGDLIDQAYTLGISKVLYKPLRRRDIFEVMDEMLGGDQALSKLKIQKLFEKQDNMDIEDEDKESIELKSKLVRMFLKSADLRIRDVKSAIDVKNQFMLKSVVHELRGLGTSIGYIRLTMLGEYVENLLDKEEKLINWNEVETFCKKILDLIDQIIAENKEEL